MLPTFLASWSTEITSTISDVLEKTFDVLMTPFLAILKVVFSLLFSLLYTLISKALRSWLYILLKMVDFLESVFDIFTGLQPVYYNSEETTLLDLFFRSDAISSAFAAVTLVGVIVCFVFTAYTVAKSVGTFMLENKKPVGHVLRQALKSALMFVMMPLLAYFGVTLSTQLLASTDLAITSAMGGTNSVQMSTVLFLSGTFDGAEAGESYGDGDRKPFLDGEKSVYDSNPLIADFSTDAKSRFNMVTVDFSGFDDIMQKDSDKISPNDFISLNVGTYNYLLVYAECIFVIIMLLCGMFLFVRRLIEVLILYVTAPLFVSSIPLDDGEVFGRWREMFIGKLISGYGTVFSMRIMMMLIPIIFDGGVQLVGEPMTDTVIKTIFALGSLYASLKCQHTILEAFNPEIAHAARQTTGAIIGMGKKAASMAVKAGAAVATGGASAAAGAAGAAASAASAAGGAAGAAGAAGGAAGAAGGAAGAAGGAFTGGAGSAVGGLSTGGAGGAAGGSGGASGGAGGAAGGAGGASGGSGGASGGAGGASGGSDGGSFNGGSDSGSFDGGSDSGSDSSGGGSSSKPSKPAKSSSASSRLGKVARDAAKDMAQDIGNNISAPEDDGADKQ